MLGAWIKVNEIASLEHGAIVVFEIALEDHELLDGRVDMG